MLSYSKPAADSDPLFQQESLTLKEIMNLARGAPIKDWPPPPPFKGLFRDIKDAIGRGELPAARHPSRPKFDSVRLLDLSKFVYSRGERWQLIRDVCERWAISQSNTEDVPSRKQGRPSRAEEIKAAYHILKSQRQINFSKPRSATYKKIRKMVYRSSGESKGLGDDTMRKIIAPLFDSDKETNSKPDKL